MMDALFVGLPVWLNLLFFILGGVLITKAADRFVYSAVKISIATRIPKMLIGGTIVSLATTSPEFAVSFIATVQGKSDVAIGNSIGSCIINIGLIASTCILIRPVLVEKKRILAQGAFMVAAGLLVYALSGGNVITRLESLFLIAGLLGYLYYCTKTARSDMSNPDSAAQASMEGHKINIGKQFLLFLVGAFGIILGSSLLVGNVTPIAKYLGVPDLIIALTLVALGTSLPEYVVSLTAAFRKHGDIGIGNIIGADILDIFWVLGGCSLYAPLTVTRQTRVLDYPVMLIMMLLLLVFRFTNRRIERWEGATLFGLLVVYLVLMFVYFA
ncbi:MAG: calcium/sodium antiporter [Deltaproteobacteria bacterium]|nr:calcium/sodium antiporter [Deltaproteobacteria bacterium]